MIYDDSAIEKTTIQTKTHSFFLKQALMLIAKYHKDQKDKTGKDYKHHLFAVKDLALKEAESLKLPSEIRDKIALVALLHDIIEDTECSLEDLKELNFDSEVIKAIKLLSKNLSQKFQSNLNNAEIKNKEKEKLKKAYFTQIKTNDLARIVKKADLMHNSDLSRFDTTKLIEKDINRTIEYLRWLKFLIQNEG